MAGYKELRNIIFNELNITKVDIEAWIRDEIKQTVLIRTDSVVKSMLDGKDLDKILNNTISKKVSDMIYPRVYENDGIKRLVKEIIGEILINKYDLNFSKK